MIDRHGALMSDSQKKEGVELFLEKPSWSSLVCNSVAFQE